MEKSNISVIIPIHTVIDLDQYLPKALESVTKNTVQPDEILIVRCACPEVTEFLSGYDFGDMKNKIRTVETKKTKEFAHMVNSAVEEVKTDYFSILEFDDEYSSIWFKNVKKYTEAYPEVQMFLPVVVETDEKGSFAGFTNEATFAANFTQEMGFLTNETLQDYQNFQTAGSVIKKQVIDDFGGFKPSVKLTFVYEFLLRLTYNSVSIMSIPKLGYKHTNLREGSIFWNYKNGEDKMVEDEVKFWVQTAKKEFFFTDDRNIKYQLENV